MQQQNVHYMATSMQTPEYYTHMWWLNISFQNHGHSFAAIKAYKVDTINTVLESGCKDLLPLSHKSISEVGLASNPVHPKEMGLRSRLCRLVKRFHQILKITSLLTLICGSIFTLKQERTFTKLLPQSWKHTIIWNVFGTEGRRSWKSWKRAPSGSGWM